MKIIFKILQLPVAKDINMCYNVIAEMQKHL